MFSQQLLADFSLLMFPLNRSMTCFQLSIDESPREFCFCVFFETPFAELQAGRVRTLCTLLLVPSHICPRPPRAWLRHSPQALLLAQVWRHCRAVTPHGFLQVSYLVPICVDILSWVFSTACLACIYLSDKPQFGFKTCLLRSWLKMKFFPGYVFPLVALLTVT